MSLYGRRKRDKPADSPFWRDIQKCNGKLDKRRQDACRSGDGFESPITGNDQRFLDSLVKRGPNYIMSGQQVHWFQAIARKIHARF